MKSEKTPAASASTPDGRGSYAENRKVLREVAEKLRHETSLDIDELIPLIDQASAAYRACRDRVDAVERLIAERLPQIGSDEGEK